MDDQHREYVTNLHVHTTYSDGSGTMEEVIEAAQKAKLDILMINDHDTLAAKNDGYEGYHDGLLVLVGVEFSGRHNHYLAYGVDDVPAHSWREPQKYIDYVREADGVGFLAHPFEKGSPLSEGGLAFTWEDWSVENFNGLCVWNHTSSWKTKARNKLSAYIHFFLHTWTLDGPDRETLGKWDRLGQTRRVVGVGGSDAHAFETKAFGRTIQIFPYQTAFRAVNTHILLPEELSGDLDRDRRMVLSALKQGSCFIAHDRLMSANGFDFRLSNRDKYRCGQGGETTIQPGDTLSWTLPGKASVRLVRNGRPVWSGMCGNGTYPVESAGVYRVEAHLPVPLFGQRPWLFSNPIYCRAG